MSSASFFAANPNTRRSPPGKWQDGRAIVFYRTQHSHRWECLECLGSTWKYSMHSNNPKFARLLQLEARKKTLPLSTQVLATRQKSSKNLPCKYYTGHRPLAHFRGSFQPPSGCKMLELEYGKHTIAWHTEVGTAISKVLILLILLISVLFTTSDNF